MTTDSKQPSRDQWAVLGGLRFFLALVVCCSHLEGFGAQEQVVHRLGLFDAGHAVWMFFIVSGFSIAHSISKEPSGYLVRRLVRLYPLYITSLVVTFLLVTLRLGEHQGWLTWVGNTVFLQTIAVPRLSSDSQLWSLASEVVYYILAIWFVKAATNHLAKLAVLSFGLCIVMPDVVAPTSLGYMYGITPITLLWVWLIGFLAYRHREHRYINILLPVIVLTAIITTREISAAPLCETVLTLLAILLPVAPGTLSPKTIRVLNYAGGVSYALYVLHYPLGAALQILSKNGVAWANFTITSGAGLILILLLSCAAYSLIDAPIQARFRRRATVRFAPSDTPLVPSQLTPTEQPSLSR